MLTDKEIKVLLPQEKTYRVSDGGGLYLEIPPVGKKWWRLRYFLNGKEKSISLGTYPEVSLKTAHFKRDEARILIHNGADPSTRRKAAKAAPAIIEANAFEFVAREWMEKQRTVWTNSNYNLIDCRLKKNVFKIIGTRPIDSFTPVDLLAVLRPIEEAGRHETAHRVRIAFGQIFRYAVATGRIPSDPSRDLRGALSPTKTVHRAAVTDPDEVKDLLASIDAYKGSVIVEHALRLAPLVFVRPGELRAAEWKDIDLKKNEWGFIVQKTKTPHIVPLATQAVAVLRGIYSTTGSGRYVFPSPRTIDSAKQRPMSNNAILSALRRMGIEGDEMCGHGFRAMARTILEEVLKFPPHLIEHQLAHVVRDPNGRAYNRTTLLDERKVMMQRWADYLDELRKKDKKS